MIEWNLDTGCPVAVGFGMPHELVRGNRDHRLCGWRNLWGKPDGPAGWSGGWNVRGAHFVCYHTDRCRHCWVTIPAPTRQCPDWVDRPPTRQVI